MVLTIIERAQHFVLCVSKLNRCVRVRERSLEPTCRTSRGFSAWEASSSTADINLSAFVRVLAATYKRIRYEY